MTTKTTKKKKVTKKRKVTKKKPRKNKNEVVVVVDGKKKELIKVENARIYKRKTGGRYGWFFWYKQLDELIDEYLETKTGEYWEKDVDPAGNEHFTKKLRVPKIVSFARFIGVSERVVNEWKSEHKNFSQSIDKIMDAQKEMYIDGASTGMLRENFSRFVLTVNHGMVDKTEVENKFSVGSINILPPGDQDIIEIDAIEKGDE